MLKVNLGCGSDLLAGWVNCDRVIPTEVEDGPWVKEDDNLWVAADFYEDTYFRQVDATEPWPFPDGSVTHLLTKEVLEHIVRPAPIALEAWRVLEPGGRWEIIVPQYPGRRWFASWDHVSPWTRARFQALADPDRDNQWAPHDLTFNLASLGPARSPLRRLREWWNWLEPPNLRCVYEKPQEAHDG